MKIKSLLFTMLLSSITTSFALTKEIDDIFKAVESNNLVLVKRLVKKGVPLNELNKDKQTVLDIATEKQQNRIARHLLQHGAKVSTQNNAILLDNYLKKRAVGFFVSGWIFTPFLWLGGGLALANRSLIQVL